MILIEKKFCVDILNGSRVIGVYNLRFGLRGQIDLRGQRSYIIPQYLFSIDR